ncbi:MAG: hypothetical protein HY040_15110 [Planctomycetes bacterium]|nr:hypothetical protein [Planctomycetota bacterium]
MAPYFYLLESAFFLELTTSLGECRRQRSFSPSLDLCMKLRGRGVPSGSVCEAVIVGLTFDRHIWHALIGDCLVHGASDIPRIPIDPSSLCQILAPNQCDESARERFTSIQQVLYGSRDLRFGGGYYRPDQAGFNALEDVARLSVYLSSVDPRAWIAESLHPKEGLEDEHERAEELAQLRDWWPALVEMYVGADAKEQVIVCEVI